MRRCPHLCPTAREPTDEHIYVGDPGAPMSKTLLAALDEVTSMGADARPPLGYAVDLDAVNRLYAGEGADPPLLTFRYRDYTVTIVAPQEVRIQLP